MAKRGSKYDGSGRLRDANDLTWAVTTPDGGMRCWTGRSSEGVWVHGQLNGLTVSLLVPGSPFGISPEWNEKIRRHLGRVLYARYREVQKAPA